jgi:hypothetical protein
LFEQPAHILGALDSVHMEAIGIAAIQFGIIKPQFCQSSPLKNVCNVVIA